MYAGSTVPTGAEYDGRNYADFSQTDGSGNPIIVIYEGQNGAWVQTDTITPPATYNGYITVTSKIWDIVEQTGQQGGSILWSYNQKTFTPYPRIISFEDFANTNLDNLTSTGANISNWSHNVSNCITEIPQDIKVELNSGVLTLKAGSKVYVPNGAGVFDTVTIPQDLTITRTDTNKCMVWRYSAGNLGIFPVQLFYSGPTAPTQYTFMFWYDTTNNLCKYTSDGGSTWISGASFPLCLVSTDGTKISAIDQVFNGFGYVGNSIFVLPGVKGLNPQGLNADGTLNNTTVTISSVMTRTLTTSATDQILMAVVDNSNLQAVILEVFEDTPDVSDAAWCYSIKQNKLGVYTPSDQSWTQTGKIIVGTVNATTGEVITSLNQKTTFHAVDYSNSGVVVAEQLPTSSNNYTWFRKYANGWVEQGGSFSGTVSTAYKSHNVTLPITMSTPVYNLVCQTCYSSHNGLDAICVTTKSTTGFTVDGVMNSVAYGATWQVSGIAA